MSILSLRVSRYFAAWQPFVLILALVAFGMTPIAAQAAKKPPNILFIIMDDVGIDQMKAFDFGGEIPDQVPRTPNIDIIADAGIKFRNTWAMPACSTSRAVFFNGRYPLRTNVYGALGPDDLANSMVSPYEMTLPSLLKQANYKSAIFGKYHLGLQGNNPFKDLMPRSLGWDYFYGWLDVTGDPSSIDITAGGVGGDPEDGGNGYDYACGFVPGVDPDNDNGGADFGACYAAHGGCSDMTISDDGIPPGRTCRDNGGILDPGASCQLHMPENIESGFQNYSGHYVSPLVINTEDGLSIEVPASNIEARTFRGTIQVDAAIDWIQKQPKKQPWMASVSFSTAHTPVMQPPQALLTTDPAATSNISCVNKGDNPIEIGLAQRAITSQMIEALDTEFARLLVSIGVASRDHKGQLKYNPNNNDTMIVILGDNGTLGNTVKLPFDPGRAKGTAYQTGVWVPLIVAGQMVKKPSRSVWSMVNIADLYQLFGELAGIDVPASVPRKLDSVAMLPYLTNPKQESIREYNFTQVGTNLQIDGAINGPCAIAGGCTQIPVSKGVCTDNAGTWYGPDGEDPGFTYCCDVNKHLYEEDPTQTLLNLQPLRSVAIRNDDFKVVRNFYRGEASPNPDTSVAPTCDDNVSNEFYRISESNPLLLDRSGSNLLETEPVLTPHQLANYVDLTEKLVSMLSSEPICLGDGNIDGVVDGKDLLDWELFSQLTTQVPDGGSSWYDINKDGQTDEADRQIILARQGTICSDL